MAQAIREEVTGLLLAWRGGDADAFERLLPLVYAELRRIAGRQMAAERPGASLQATALVHEAYLRMVDYDRVEIRDRGHFLALAAQAMRRVLIDAARTRHAQRRGAGAHRVALEEALDIAMPQDDALLALDEALDELAGFDARKARGVELRYFGGLSIEEAAQVLGVSHATVERDWHTARLWLRARISQQH
ncbi:sigma-70 family RNA polymerase sigma factor [soil metagenome]